MAKNGSKDGSRRVVLYIPPDDVSVSAWVDAQANVNLSLRTMIRRWVATEGYFDLVARYLFNEPAEATITSDLVDLDPVVGEVDVVSQAAASFDIEPVVPEPILAAFESKPRHLAAVAVDSASPPPTPSTDVPDMDDLFAAARNSR